MNRFLFQLRRVDDWEFKHQLLLILVVHVGPVLLIYFGIKFFFGD